MSRDRKRPEVEEAVQKLRAQTHCARCGKQPIEWHGEHHPERPGRRISNMVDLGYRLDAVLAEIAVCTPLCRSCHMKSDGRTERLIESAAKKNRGVAKAVKGVCSVCNKPAVGMSAGKCKRCYHKDYMRQWRQKKEV